MDSKIFLNGKKEEKEKEVWVYREEMNCENTILFDLSVSRKGKNSVSFASEENVL